MLACNDIALIISLHLFATFLYVFPFIAIPLLYYSNIIHSYPERQWIVIDYWFKRATIIAIGIVECPIPIKLATQKSIKKQKKKQRDKSSSNLGSNREMSNIAILI